MRKITALFSAFMIVAAIAMTVAAADGEKKNVTNKTCPVMNAPVSEKFRTEYNGQYVYFCCEGCIKTFEKEPDKYVAKLSKDDAEAIKANDTCPLTSEKITSREHWVEDGGKKVYLCCLGCLNTYKAKMAEKKSGQ